MYASAANIELLALCCKYLQVLRDFKKMVPMKLKRGLFKGQVKSYQSHRFGTLI